MKPTHLLKSNSGRSGAGSQARAWLVGVLAVLAMSGCRERSEPAPNPVPTATPLVETRYSDPAYTTPTVTGALREAAREAGQDLRDLGNRVEARIESTDFEAKREAFLRNSRDELDKLKASIDKLGERTAVAGENAKDNFQEMIADLRTRSRDAESELDRAQASGSDTWDESESKSETALQRLKEGYNATLERMKVNE